MSIGRARVTIYVRINVYFMHGRVQARKHCVFGRITLTAQHTCTPVSQTSSHAYSAVSFDHAWRPNLHCCMYCAWEVRLAAHCTYLLFFCRHYQAWLAG